jgi:predicted phosphodiesterase
MRALILSDVHANLEALQAVLKDASVRGGFQSIWCLGDLVGYGPDPRACLALLREYQLLAVAGNHDHAAIGRIEPELFNSAAAAAARWTAAQLSPEEIAFLGNLPLTITSEPFTLVHGSLRAPVWEYLLNQESALGTLNLLKTRFCLVGHSHLPFICRENRGSPDFIEFTEDEVIPLNAERWIINPGGVGQPRDQDPRPSYAIYDDREATIERHRVAYEISATQQKMAKAGLPQNLIDRLDYGL